MHMKSNTILMLYLLFFTIGISAPVFAGPPPEKDSPVSAENKGEGLICQNRFGRSGLTLEMAVNEALKHNPDLNVLKFNPRLAESEKLQSSLFPNPELEFEYENFDEPEKTLTIGYLIELGGKRSHRMGQADAVLELAQAELEAARVEIISETAAAYIDVLVARENLRITREKEKLSDQVYETARERVLAGRVPPMEQVTAEIKRSNARLEVIQAEDELLISRTRLSAMWGGLPDDFASVTAAFERIQSVPSFDALIAALDNAPVIETMRLEIKVAQTSLELEKRNRIPDLFLSGGIKKTDESDDAIYIVGLSLPIPLFDRNQAGVARTAAELSQQTFALSAEQSRLAKDLKIAFQTLKTAHQQVNTIKTDILPSAQRVLDAVKEGYQEGEFSFLDMLEAQSTLYESHESYINSLGQYHHAVVDLEKLLGKDLASFNSNNQKMFNSRTQN